jgi:glycine/D-amino acid oxidase-like deaminating enzyme
MRHPAFDPLKHRITILEASEIAGGASGKAGGLLALWAYPSSIVPLSYRLHEELAKEHGGKERWGYREVNCGQVVAEAQSAKAASKKGAADAVSLDKRSGKAMDMLKAAGIPDDLDWFDPGTLKMYEDMAGPRKTAQVHPYLFTTSMAKLAEEKGASVVLGSVTKITSSSEGVNGVTYTDKATGKSETLQATDVIVSAGPWSQRVFPPAPIEALRAHSVAIRPTRPVSAYTLFTNIAMPAGSGGRREKVLSPEIYARPDETVYACGEGDTTVTLPETTASVAVDQSRCQAILDAIGSVSSELRDGEVLVRQACYLPLVSGGRGGPLIGKTNIDGLYLATGHTCWGIQNAPGTGKLISELVFDGEAKSASIGNLDPRKFL